MKKGKREKMNTLLEDFLNNTSMHGLKYIARSDRSWVERFVLQLVDLGSDVWYRLRLDLMHTEITLGIFELVHHN